MLIVKCAKELYTLFILIKNMVYIGRNTCKGLSGSERLNREMRVKPDVTYNRLYYVRVARLRPLRFTAGTRLSLHIFKQGVSPSRGSLSQSWLAYNSQSHHSYHSQSRRAVALGASILYTSASQASAGNLNAAYLLTRRLQFGHS